MWAEKVSDVSVLGLKVSPGVAMKNILRMLQRSHFHLAHYLASLFSRQGRVANQRVTQMLALGKGKATGSRIGVNPTLARDGQFYSWLV
jgi:hypothetical protein